MSKTALLFAGQGAQVVGMGKDLAGRRAFVLTLIDLARRLNLRTVAERVQDEEAAKMLADAGCDYLQGKLIGLARLERPRAGAA